MAIFSRKEHGEKAIAIQTTVIQAIEIERQGETGRKGQTDRERVTKTDGQRHAKKDILRETN